MDFNSKISQCRHHDKGSSCTHQPITVLKHGLLNQWLKLSKHGTTGPKTLTHGSVIEDLGISTVRVFATQLPDIEEWLPVDVRHQSWDVVVRQQSTTEKRWCNSTQTQTHQFYLPLSQPQKTSHISTHHSSALSQPPPLTRSHYPIHRLGHDAKLAINTT